MYKRGCVKLASMAIGSQEVGFSQPLTLVTLAIAENCCHEILRHVDCRLSSSDDESFVSGAGSNTIREVALSTRSLDDLKKMIFWKYRGALRIPA